MSSICTCVSLLEAHTHISHNRHSHKVVGHRHRHVGRPCFWQVCPQNQPCHQQWIGQNGGAVDLPDHVARVGAVLWHRQERVSYTVCSDLVSQLVDKHCSGHRFIVPCSHLGVCAYLFDCLEPPVCLAVYHTACLQTSPSWFRNGTLFWLLLQRLVTACVDLYPCDLPHS